LLISNYFYLKNFQKNGKEAILYTEEMTLVAF